MFHVANRPERQDSAAGRVYDLMHNKDATPVKDATSVTSEQKEPIADIGLQMTLKSVEIHRNKYHQDITLEAVPGTVSVPITPEGYELLKRKFELCSHICDFSDTQADLEAKDVKRETLVELDALFDKKSALLKWPSDVWECFYEMVDKNVFRSLPVTNKKNLIYPDAPVITEVFWPHLELVYSLLLKYGTANPKFAGWNQKYCQKLIENYSAPDAAERAVVSKLMELYIRNNKTQLQHVMDEFAYILVDYCEGETVPFPVFGILEFFMAHYAKLDGQFFAKFLPEYVIPLISSQHFYSFRLVVQQIFELYVSMDPNWCVLIVEQILRRWPESNAAKEETFVLLLMSVVQDMNLKVFTRLAVPMFTRLAKCACSESAKVVHLSFAIWHDVKIIPMVMDNTSLVFPIIIPPLLKTMREHWSKDVQAKVLNTLKVIRDLNSLKFDELSARYKSQQVKLRNSQAEFSKSQTKWVTIARAAAAHDRTIDLSQQLAEISKVFLYT